MKCPDCQGCGMVVKPVVVGFDDEGNPIISQSAIICERCYGSGEA